MGFSSQQTLLAAEKMAGKFDTYLCIMKLESFVKYRVQMYLDKRKYLRNENRCNLKSNPDLARLVQSVLILLRVLLRLRNFVVNLSASM